MLNFSVLTVLFAHLVIFMYQGNADAFTTSYYRIHKNLAVFEVLFPSAIDDLMNITDNILDRIDLNCRTTIQQKDTNVFKLYFYYIILELFLPLMRSISIILNTINFISLIPHTLVFLSHLFDIRYIFGLAQKLNVYYQIMAFLVVPSANINLNIFKKVLGYLLDICLLKQIFLAEILSPEGLNLMFRHIQAIPYRGKIKQIVLAGFKVLINIIEAIFYTLNRIEMLFEQVFIYLFGFELNELNVSVIEAKNTMYNITSSKQDRWIQKQNKKVKRFKLLND